MSVTLPWESKATGEPDFAELPASVSPLHQDMAPIYYLNSSTGNFPAKILICADVCFSSACILITGGSLWSEAPLQLHNFPSNRFSSGLILISFWHSSFFFVMVDIQVQLRGGDKGRGVVLIEPNTGRGDIRQPHPRVGHGVMTTTSGMEWEVGSLDYSFTSLKVRTKSLCWNEVHLLL